MIRTVTVESKKRIAPNTPGNMAPPDMSGTRGDKVGIILGYLEADGQKMVEFSVILAPEEVRGVDVGDRFTMTIDFSSPIGQPEDGTTANAEASS